MHWPVVWSAAVWQAFRPWVVSGVAGGLLALLYVPLAWAGGIWLYEGGAPDVGSASAGRAALADDASTAFGNPAGMTRLDRSQVLLGVQPYFVQASFDKKRGTSTAGGSGGNAGGFSPLPSWGGVLPLLGSYGVYSLSDDVKLGLSLNSYAGGSLDYDGEWAGRYYAQRADLLTLNFNPSIAYRLNSWLSVGAGFSVMYAKLVQKAAINNAFENLPDGRLIVRDSTVGYGGNAGLLIELSERTRFGVTYRSQVDLDFEDVAKIDGAGPVLRAALNRAGLRASKLDLGMTVPQAVMVSGYHELNDKLAIMANVGWQNWEQFGKVDVQVRSQDTRDLTVNSGYDDTWHAAIGAQFRLIERWVLSTGFAYDSSAQTQFNRTVATPMDEQLRFATGLQYEWTDDVTLGLAYEYLDLGENEVRQSRGPLAGTLQGDYSSMGVHFISLNVSMKF